MDYELAKKLKEAGFPQYEDCVMSAEDVSPQNVVFRRDHRTFDLSLGGYPETEPDYFEQGKWRASCLFSSEYLESEIGKKETLYFPTLEELIEACPQSIKAINHNKKRGKEIGNQVEHFFTLSTNTEEWLARYEFYESYLDDKYGNPISCEGATPSEAVANLWLVLHANEVER